MVHHAKNEHIDIFILYGLSLCIVISLSLYELVVKYTTAQHVFIPYSVVVNKDMHPFFNQTVFQDIKVEGKAYIVYDLTDNTVIASKNLMSKLPLASITKVMTAISSTLHKKHDEKIVITPASIEDGYDLGLKNKQEWKLDELLKYTLVMSSNDGAEAVADSFGDKHVFLALMNNDARSFGLNLTFTDPAGRDLNGNIGGLGTVLDVAKLFGIAREQIPDILDATTKKRETVFASNGRISGIPNTNQHIEGLPGAEASKTGYTDMAGGNLGVIVDISVGHPVVIVVLGSTREGRFRDMNTLYVALRKSLHPFKNSGNNQ